MIVPMREEHAAQVADLHQRYIDSLLSRLGPGVCQSFYLHALRRPECFGFVDLEAGRVRGFVLGATDNSRLFSAWSLRLSILRSLARRPAIARRILFHLSGELDPAPELLYEAVGPQWRRRGIATALTLALREGYRSRGVERYEIRVDRDNIPNLARHRKLGARIVREFSEGSIERYLLDSPVEIR